MALNLHHLRVFAAAVRSGGVGVAARTLGTSQPAVSRAIADLERDLGVALLERSTRGVRPTSAGRELYEHAQAVVAAERAAEEAMAAARGLSRGTLHIGASTTIATYVLPPLIGAFARTYPGVDVRLSAVHTRVLVPLVLEHEVDVAIAEAPVTHPRITATRWITDGMVVIAAPTHPLAVRAAAGPIRPAALAHELLILREPESGTRTIVLRELAAAGVTPTRTMAVDGTEVIKQLVAEGLGIAVVSRDTVNDQVALGRIAVVPVVGLRITRPFNRLTGGRRHPSAATAAFLARLTEEARRRDPALARPARTREGGRPRRGTTR